MAGIPAPYRPRESQTVSERASRVPNRRYTSSVILSGGSETLAESGLSRELFQARFAAAATARRPFVPDCSRRGIRHGLATSTRRVCALDTARRAQTTRAIADSTAQSRTRPLQ